MHNTSSVIGRLLARIDGAYVIFGLALLIGLTLRLYGIGWDLPDSNHPNHSYHPDEALHFLAAQMLASGQMIAKHFMYGGTLYYTLLNTYVFFAGHLGEALGGFNRLANAILVGRYFQVGIALLTILVVYECGRAYFGKTTGALAALILAIAPLHIVFAQQVRPDEMSALFPVLVILICSKLLSGAKRHRYRYYVYGGIAIGVATALRFPLIVLFLAPVTAHLLVSMTGHTKSEVFGALRNPRLAVMGLSTVFGYLLASPHTLFYPQWFVEGLKIQWHYQSTPFADAVDSGAGVYQYGWLMLRQALGYPFYFLAVSGVVLAVVRRSRADLVILAAGVPYFLLVTFASWVVVRYTLPLLPLLAVLAASAIVRFAEMVSRYRFLIHSLFGVALACTLMADYAFLKVEAGKNVRDVATEWIEQNARHGSSVLIVKAYPDDDFNNPVIPKNYDQVTATFYSGGDIPVVVASRSQWQAPLYAVASLFQNFRFDFLVLHEDLYKNMERLGERHPDKNMWEFFRSLRKSRYKMVTEFKQPMEVFGIDFSGWFTENDYLFANLGIRIYQYQD